MLARKSCFIVQNVVKSVLPLLVLVIALAAADAIVDRTRTHTHSLTHTLAHTHSRSHTHTHTRTYTLARTHTRSHTHTYLRCYISEGDTSVLSTAVARWRWHTRPNVVLGSRRCLLLLQLGHIILELRCFSAGVAVLQCWSTAVSEQHSAPWQRENIYIICILRTKKNWVQFQTSVSTRSFHNLYASKYTLYCHAPKRRNTHCIVMHTKRRNTHCIVMHTASSSLFRV